MQINLRAHASLGIAMVLLVLIAILSVLLYANGPRVRFIDFERDPARTSLHEGSRLVIHFDRPLKDADYSEQIQISPSVGFTTQTANQSITLLLEENLESQQTYTITVGPNIVDTTERSMRSTYEHVFSTQAPKFYYLERDIDGVADSVFRATEDGDTEEVFTHPTITMFAASDSYLVVAVREDSEDKLITLDLQSGQQREEELILRGRIDNLSLGPRSTVALLTVQPDFSSVSREYYDRFADRIDSVDLTTGDIISLTDADDDYIRASSITMDPSGQVAIVQTTSRTFYAVSPFNDYDPLLIGSYSDLYGFSADSSQIYFRSNGTFITYDISSGETKPFDSPNEGFIQSIEDSQAGLYVTQSNGVEGSIISSIYRTEQGTNSELQWISSELSGDTISSVSPSYDGRTLALTINPSRCRFDQVAPNAQCSGVYTILWDTVAAEQIAEFQGFDLQWAP